MSTKITDRQARIVAAALTVLQSAGWSALTQPRVALAAGLRQSHLTYYFPTRRDLVTAISREVARRLVDGFERLAREAPADPGGFGKSFARLCSPEQTRLLLTLVLAADTEPAIRRIFRVLTKDVRARIASAIGRMGADADAVALIHALGVGLAVLDLARDEPAARCELQRIAAMPLARGIARRKPPKNRSKGSRR
ncbi:MAG TPA: TetR/AcrR family transcriptional regulator [Stellaceae bacterium]|nr:TetR/AcrR family transcriptional regulator [Stellaceae bacterium]